MSASLRKALSAAACSTCCSVSRAAVQDGTGGWRLSTSSMADDRRALRRRMRAARRAVPAAERAPAAAAIDRRIASLGLPHAGHPHLRVRALRRRDRPIRRAAAVAGARLPGVLPGDHPAAPPAHALRHPARRRHGRGARPALARPGARAPGRLRRARHPPRHGRRVLRPLFRVPPPSPDLAAAPPPRRRLRRAAPRTHRRRSTTTCPSGAS